MWDFEQFCSTSNIFQVRRIALWVERGRYRKECQYYSVRSTLWSDVRYCQILSDIVGYCRILSDIARYCHCSLFRYDGQGLREQWTTTWRPAVGCGEQKVGCWLLEREFEIRQFLTRNICHKNSNGQMSWMQTCQISLEIYSDFLGNLSRFAPGQKSLGRLEQAGARRARSNVSRTLKE